MRTAGMNKRCAAALLFFAVPVHSTAQETVKILTPTTDTCLAFMAAMNSADPTKVTALGGWALGFLSGVAQGTDRDILRGATAQGVMNRLYSDCQKQPERPMSIVLEEMARSLATAPQSK